TMSTVVMSTVLMSTGTTSPGMTSPGTTSTGTRLDELGQPVPGDLALRGLETAQRGQPGRRGLERAAGQVARDRAQHGGHRVPAGRPAAFGGGKQPGQIRPALHGHARR